MRQAVPLSFIYVYCFHGLHKDLNIYYIHIWREGRYISLNVFFLLTWKKWKRLSKLATALVADQKRNVYGEFMMASLSPMNGDVRVSREGHKPACSHSRYGWEKTLMSELDGFRSSRGQTQTVTWLKGPPYPNWAVICAARTGTWSPGEGLL